MSTIYADADQFKTLFSRLFAQINEETPDRLDPLVKKKMVVVFRVHDPDVEMWIDGRSKPVQTSFSEVDGKLSLAAELIGNTLHELLLGTVPLGKGLSSGRLKVKGSFLKARKLEDLLHACQEFYPALAEEMLDAD
ncbi:MAG: hypothetical protein ACR2QE_04865 [Acidimicrobiales bacterium]